MGKVRNARRNPPVSADDLLDTQWAGENTVVHMGQELRVLRSGGNRGAWLLQSGQGVRYSARIQYDGSVNVELLGL